MHQPDLAKYFNFGKISSISENIMKFVWQNLSTFLGIELIITV